MGIRLVEHLHLRNVCCLFDGKGYFDGVRRMETPITTALSTGGMPVHLFVVHKSLIRLRR